MVPLKPSLCGRWSTVAPAVFFLVFVGLFLKFALHPGPSNLEDSVSDMADHLRGVRLERDGDLNSDFRQEVLLGEGEFERRKEENPKDLLEDIFVRADENRDGFLSHKELSRWIAAKIQQHIDQAHADNYYLFASVDIRPKDGFVSWEEYQQYSLNQREINKEGTDQLDRKMKEAVMRDKAAWSEASRSNLDHLTVDEFLTFRHPESSYSTILALVEELFNKFDRDGDEILTEDEFSLLHIESDLELERKARKQGEEERRREFRAEIDKDSDGKADRRELLMYIDPRNPRHAREEAQTLIGLADVNRDGLLALSEILNKMDLFLGSKMVDTAKSFHDEF